MTINSEDAGVILSNMSICYDESLDGVKDHELAKRLLIAFPEHMDKYGHLAVEEDV